MEFNAYIPYSNAVRNDHHHYQQQQQQPQQPQPQQHHQRRYPQELPLLNTQLYTAYNDHSPISPALSVSLHNNGHYPSASSRTPISEISLPESTMPLPSYTQAEQALMQGRPSSASVSSSTDKPARRSGKESSNIVIACRQCRSRKIRCDSTRPVCHNCTRRCNDCEYDSTPKRRGPDKKPGTRQRSCKKRPVDGSAPPPAKKRKKDSPDDDDIPPPSAVSTTSHSPVPSSNSNPQLRPQQHQHQQQYHHLMNKSSPSVPSISSTGIALYSPPSILRSSHARLNQDQRVPPPASPEKEANSPFGLYGSGDNRRSLSDLHGDPFPYGSLFPYNYDSNTTTATPEMDRHPPPPYLGIPPSPSVDFSRKVWWDNLLSMYSHDREHSARQIYSDMSFLFSSTNYWLSFFNVQLFFRCLQDATERSRMQPSLVLSGLALATLMKSSESPGALGADGRDRSLWLRDCAQSSLDASLAAQSIDPTLAQAALVLALFEASAHPKHTSARASSALIFLDSIIRSLALTRLDERDPETSMFVKGHVPSVVVPPSLSATTSPSASGSVVSDGGRHSPPQGPPLQQTCTCSTPQAPTHHLQSYILGSSWICAPPWDTSWTVAETRKEESRRLCWCALTLAAAHTAHCAAFHREPLDLFLVQPENYALLFPGETLLRSQQQQPHQRHISPSGSGTGLTPPPMHTPVQAQSPKESVWALYCRSMLLWNSCLRLRDEALQDSEKAEFAMQAWLEANSIQESLDNHVCGAETALLYVGREYLFNTRMAITYEFRRVIPLADAGFSPMFHRKKAEEWLYYQSVVAKRVKTSFHLLTDVHDDNGNMLARRPWYVWWFMSQVAISLSLWTYDRTLTQALDLCNAFLVPIDVLTALWPCEAQRERYNALREKLAAACVAAGIAPPSHTMNSLPSLPPPSGATDIKLQSPL